MIEKKDIPDFERIVLSETTNDAPSSVRPWTGQIVFEYPFQREREARAASKWLAEHNGKGTFDPLSPEGTKPMSHHGYRVHGSFTDGDFETLEKNVPAISRMALNADLGLNVKAMRAKDSVLEVETASETVALNLAWRVRNAIATQALPSVRGEGAEVDKHNKKVVRIIGVSTSTDAQGGILNALYKMGFDEADKARRQVGSKGPAMFQSTVQVSPDATTVDRSNQAIDI